MSNIVLNKSNITNNNNNSKLLYQFPSDVTFNETNEVVISHMSLYYSWFNITASNNNNFFQYTWWDSQGDMDLGHVVVNVTIDDGYYTIGTLFEYLIKVMVKNGHYLVLSSDANSYVYCIELLTNETYYSSEIRLSSLGEMYSTSGSTPIASTSAFITPTGWTIPTKYQCPTILIPSNNKFGSLIGFNGGQVKIPDATISQIINDNYSILNDFTPQMEPQASFIITCSLVKNQLSIPNNVLASFSVPGGSSIGDMISPVSDVVWSHIAPGQYSQFSIEIFDQDFNPLIIRDPTMLFVISIK